MNFYHAYYKRQYYKEDEEIWKDTCYNRQGIVVIADNYEEAKSKVMMCLKKVETGEYRAVLVGDVAECIGLDRRHGYDFSFDLDPIFNT